MPLQERRGWFPGPRGAGARQILVADGAALEAHAGDAAGAAAVDLRPEAGGRSAVASEPVVVRFAPGVCVARHRKERAARQRAARERVDASRGRAVARRWPRQQSRQKAWPQALLAAESFTGTSLKHTWQLTLPSGGGGAIGEEAETG